MDHADLLATVGQVAAGVAHEIRNPLAVLRGASSRLQRVEQLTDAQRRELLGMLDEEVQRMGDVVQTFLDLSKRRDAEATVFPLRPVLERSMEIMNVELSRCGVRSAVRWEAEDWVSIRGRPQAMHHLFLNLALNARDAMPNCGYTFRTVARGCPGPSARRSSSPSSRPAPRAPAWDWPSWSGSSSSMEGRFPSAAHPAAAPSSRSTCRSNVRGK